MAILIRKSDWGNNYFTLNLRSILSRFFAFTLVNLSIGISMPSFARGLKISLGYEIFSLYAMKNDPSGARVAPGFLL